MSTDPVRAAAAILAKPLLRGWLHLVCFFLAIPAGILVIVAADGPRARWGAAIYAVGLVALFGVSGSYHRGRWTDAARRRMQQLDHATIFVMIAGSYTPLCLVAIRGWVGPVMLVAAWVGATIGVVLAFSGGARSHVARGVLYIALGWVSVGATPQLLRELTVGQLVLIAVGGVLYTVGAIFLATNWPDPFPRVFGYHEVWHVLVVAAVVCHFVAISSVVAAPTRRGLNPGATGRVEKLVVLLWGEPDPIAGDVLRERLLGDVADRLLGGGARALTVNVHDSAAARAPSPAPAPEGEPTHVAQLSVWVDSYDRRGDLDEVVASAGLDHSTYLVTESLYDDYGTTPHTGPRSWPDGERSPGVLTVARIHRPVGLDHAEWIHRWHGVQSPESGRLQPRTRYVRNEVVRSLTPDAPETHGIVEEGWPSIEHVTDPMLFFNAGGDPQRCRDNIGAMLANVEACLDLARLRSSTMSEHLVRSFA